MASTFGSVDVAVRFIADATSVSKEADKLSTTGSKIKKTAVGIGAAIGGAFAVNAVSDFIGAAEEANSVQAKLTQALSNAGDASGQYAKHAADLANTLQYKTGIDDEVIKGGQTILATFHAVSGAAGQQSGAFDRATKAALDMSKAGFGSVDSASTMLGKALEDPVKGITALGKAGVTFTAAQKKMIKGFVDSGDKASAMNEILKNVEGQVGGVAEKSVTSGDKMKVAWGETQESIGQALLPLAEKLAPIVASIAEWVQHNSTLVIGLGAAAAAIWLVNIALAANPITLILVGVVALIAAIYLLWQNWDTVWSAILDLIDTVWSWIKDHWPLLLAILTGPIGLAVKFIVDHWDQIWDGIQAVFNWIKDHWQLLLAILTGPIGIAVGLIVKNWDTIWNGIKTVYNWIASAWSAVTGFLTKPIEAAAGAIRKVWDSLVDFFSKLPGRITGFVGGIADSFAGAFKSAINAVLGIWNSLKFTIGGWKIGKGPFSVTLPKVTIGLPHIPTLAQGGIVTRPTLAVIGEQGPEAVVPLNGRNGVTPAIWIEHATFNETLDVDTFMRHAAWAIQRERI